MNDLKNILRNSNVKIRAFKYIGKVVILETNKGMLVYKENSNNYKIYEYLKNRGFDNFPKIYKDYDSRIYLYEYIKPRELSNLEKLLDLIKISGKLHFKTSFKKEVDIAQIKEIYENIVNEVNYLKAYYEDMNNYIDTVVFMSPAMYLLVSNLDIINYLLSFIQVEIENWYDLVKDKKVIRYSLIHNNLSLSHLLESDYKYLISWENAKVDMPIIDLIKLYQENYYDIDLEVLLNEYEKENKLENYEYLFLLIKLSLPKKLEFTRNTLKDTYKINKYFIYLRKIVKLIQKNDDKIKNV